MKIIISGNPEYGLAKAINEELSNTDYQLDFFSRKNNYDFGKQEIKEKFAEESLNYDVYINCSALFKFHQTILLQTVWNKWNDNNKKGQIINIGSTADTGMRGGSWVYPTEKIALKNLSRQLTYSAIGGSNIRVTYLSSGYISTPNVEKKHPDKKKVKPEYIVNLIKFIINAPIEYNINEISLDPIQN